MSGEVGLSQIGSTNTRLIIFVLPDSTHYFGWFSQNVGLNVLIKYIKDSVNVRDRDKYKWLLTHEQDETKLPYKIFLEEKGRKIEVNFSKFQKALSSLTKSGPFIKIYIERNEEVLPPEQKFTFIPKKRNTKKGKSI